MKKEFTAGVDDHDRRLESVLRRLLPHQPLGIIHKALRQGDVRLNGTKAGPEAKVHQGDTLAIWDALLGAPGASDRPEVSLPAGWIVYQGVDLVVINKPSGLLVHRGEGSGPPPLDDRVRAWLASDASTSLSFRPGPLHRLDRETSGLIVFSRTLVGARTFSEALASRSVLKTYLAVLKGPLSEPTLVTARLSRPEDQRTTMVSDQGEEAVTRFRPLGQADGMTLVEVDLGTGRTHQIRAHARSIGHPLVGDSKYEGGPPLPGLEVPWFLHAWKLECPLLPPLVAPIPRTIAPWLKKKFKFSPPGADALD